jgi:DNA (cytosine-5)-methyltransferase 1
MSAYYNELEPYAAQWLRNLIVARLIPQGEVDTRSIVDIRPSDIAGYTQCHFFAGLGGWACALRLAGWPDERPIWTGSCPCQPFSVAGQGKGEADERHLWPVFFDLIRACRPAVVMGEQVAAAIGKSWLDGVFTDLEGAGYACEAAVLPACAVDAPHRRDRLWFVADADEPGLAKREREAANAGSHRSGSKGQDAADDHTALAHTPWRECEWATGADGKARRVKSGLRLLAHGVPARVGRLRAYGNAIVPQVAAEVIGAFMECRP